MFAEHDRISYSRLMDAAEAALHASLQAADDRGGESVYPADLMGHPDQPDVLADYTRFEIEEASAFLARLGVIHARPAG
jgi:hypothetical protein